MKKFTAIMLVLAMIVFVVSCGSTPNEDEVSNTQDNTEIVETNEDFSESVTDPKTESIGEVEPIEETNPTTNEEKEEAHSVDNKTVVFETNHGTFKITLWLGKAPIAAGNMVDKAESGFYNGLDFHRIVKGFVIQGGDPLGNGTGGNNMNVDPKFSGSSNVTGTVAMASSTTGNPMPYQSDAQFFINLAENTFLDDMGFIAFGEVTSGMDIVREIENVETVAGPSGEKSSPTYPVTIEKAYVK